MRSAGYSAKVHEEGQRLLADVVGFAQEREAFNVDTSSAHGGDGRARHVDAHGLRRLRASATRCYPDAAKVLSSR
jgi:hypothetical protein